MYSAYYNTVGAHSYEFTAAGVPLYFNGSGFNTGSLGNVSVRLAVPDRSVNANGLAIYGSLTKAAVATGAELMGYNGFSATDYLEQPYNSDLDFGTGDFSVMGWVKNSSSGNKMMVAHNNDGTDTPRWRITAGIDSPILFGVNSATIGSTGVFSSGAWQFFAFKRDSGVLSSFVDGDLKQTVALTTNLTNTLAKLKVGHFNAGANPFAGSLALLRISATAPTAAQIAKIYEDEKHLFQENAACTLSGTSSAVTALAHDPITGILHAGTSEGRSDFAGLRRVNNTTTAVGVSISAVDGLIVED